MTLVESDIQWRYSTKDGSQGDSEAGTPAGALGSYLSTTEVTNELFRDISASESGITIYRCIFLVNVNTTDAANDVEVWIASQEPKGGDVAIALDPTGVSDLDAATQALEIADEEEDPGLTFETPTVLGTGLEIGTLGPEECAAVWLRLSVPGNAVAQLEDGVVLNVYVRPEGA